ncbi:uncharacterized protein ATNIH1004_010361 [Aspergillus tanneri]|uniref:F-box domain-containing protein n=1 Tax=Aspergillus tanneri TaxID=1220188 RepID=A0A5M9M961_9EURO|nr:uncharacterized protein ATNIH1004_010361 [Aspergillus tanneri]KAA8643592.1 hypothetical protein ATNIH1004_010361 [Aspergillus tanneri]
MQNSRTRGFGFKSWRAAIPAPLYRSFSLSYTIFALHLDYTFIWQSGFPGLMLHHALSSPETTALSRFKFVTDVDYGGNVQRAAIVEDVNKNLEEKGYPLCNPGRFLPWFHHPSLKSLTLWTRAKKILDVPQNRRNLSQLRHLALNRATLREDELPELLSLCSSLKVLRLGMAYKWRREIALQNGSAIVKALKSVSRTVTNLSLGLEYYTPNEFRSWLQNSEEDLSTPFHGILNEFPNLRYVGFSITLPARWSTNLGPALPKTIERLSLRGDYEPLVENGWHERSILDLVASNVVKWRTNLLELELIPIRKWKPFCEKRALEKKRSEVREICEKRGVGARGGV